MCFDLSNVHVSINPNRLYRVHVYNLNVNDFYFTVYKYQTQTHLTNSFYILGDVYVVLEPLVDLQSIDGSMYSELALC
jgi:hypothetical protein